MTAIADPGSWRDPRGRIYLQDKKVYRTVMPRASEDFNAVASSGLIALLEEKKWLVCSHRLDHNPLGDIGSEAFCVLEHEKIPFISYPYEWCFSQLKAAALLHLDIQLAALDLDIVLTDASAYNIQFLHGRAIFIDLLSFRPYQEGELWAGHQQFCEQFLNPLMLHALGNIPFQQWYRGRLEGIPTNGLRHALPLRKKFSWQVFTQVVLQDSLQNQVRQSDRKSLGDRKSSLPKQNYQAMLLSLRSYLSKLAPADQRKSDWANYDTEHSYQRGEYEEKKAFIARYCHTAQPQILFDLGCNSGDFAEISLSAGAKTAVGFDFDLGALEKAYARAQNLGLDFLPLHQDLTNPSPHQGWNETERAGIGHRATANGLLALALIHHLAIRHNIPLDQIVSYLTRMATTGVIEFVPKTDPMVIELLRLREDIFDHYNIDNFRSLLRKHATIVDEENISSTGRTLFFFETR